ncbi:MAG: hypothetical protein V3S46_07885 [Nitrospinota bacterium]
MGIIIDIKLGFLRRFLFISAIFLFFLSGWADAYVGMERCRECHEDQFEAIALTKIGKVQKL